MCGIIGVVAQRNIVPVLVKGLKHLEPSPHDSCGLAVHGLSCTQKVPPRLVRMRSMHSVDDLASRANDPQLRMQGTSGIAHMRRNSVSAPTICNAQPLFSHGPHADLSQPARVAVVHNGIIDNHQGLHTNLMERAYTFTSQTDTEVIAHLMSATYQGDALQAVQRTLGLLQGAYALAVMFHDHPQRIIAAHSGLPLILGIGDNELCLVSDAKALPEQTQQMVYLSEGDVLDIRHKQYTITDRTGKHVHRPLQKSAADKSGVDSQTL